jgi:sulfur carrier protein
MKLIINQKIVEFNKIMSVQDMISTISSGSSKGIAVAVNDVVVPRTSWLQFKLSENDRITLIRATQGG